MKVKIKYIPSVCTISDPETDKRITAKHHRYRINDDVYDIRKGFMFDNASIPQLLKSFIGGGHEPDFEPAALLHDFMYRKKLGKKKADLYFRKILEYSGVGKIKRNLMYNAVKMFGGGAYKKNKSRK